MNFKTTVILCLLFTQTHGFAYATAQRPDYIIYETRFHALFSNPLESYPWPNGNAPNLYESAQGNSTANWRGYIAIWEIDRDKLYLKAINAFVHDGWEEIVREVDSDSDEDIIRMNAFVERNRPIGLEELFGRRFKKGRVFAGWFSGTLRIPMGEELEYVHMGYQSKYETDKFIEVHKGRIRQITIVDNTLTNDSNNTVEDNDHR